MPSSLTLKQLAQILNLAPSTVSRALKGHPDISEETRKRVREYALRYHYHPNAVARSLRDRRSYLIAVVVPHLTDVYYARVVSGIIGYASDRGYRTLVFESKGFSEKETGICLSLQKSGVEGVIIAPVENNTFSHLEELKTGGIPLVVFDHIIGDFESDRVVENNFESACLAVNHLIGQGCRYIMHIAGSLHLLWAQKRQMGYIQALTDWLIPVDNALILPFRSLENLSNEVLPMIRARHVDGIFALNDEIGLEILKILRQAGFRVPEEIAVCGYGNIPAGVFGCPALASVDRQEKQVGEAAMELLLKRIEKKRQTTFETCLIKNKLVLRESALLVK